MQKNYVLAALASLFLNCQNQKPPLAERLSIPSLEIRDVEPKIPENLEEKVQFKGEKCTIDLSDHFIPELLSLSRDAEQYFSANAILQDPFERERYGIYSSFKHHKEPFLHYGRAIERRGKEQQPTIDGFVFYTTPKTAGVITVLEKKKGALERELQKQKETGQNQGKIKIIEAQINSAQKELQGSGTQIETVKKVQRILRWEGFYPGEINGIYSSTVPAVMKYQKFHQRYKRYQWKIDGQMNRATRELLNQNFEDYVFSGVKRVLEERVFHTHCNGRYPYVIEQKELGKLVDSAAEQLNFSSLEGMQDFFSKEHDAATVYLDLPERYKQESMRLEIEVEKWDSGKWEKVRTRTKVKLYAIEDGTKIELFQTKAVVGGWVKNKKTGKKKLYKTPKREFHLKSLLVMPHWNPPKWAEQEEEVKDQEKLPGPFNAFGMMNTPLYYTAQPQKDPFRGWQDGDNGYRIHLTAWPSSVEHGGSSHGCIRIHPTMSRFFYFLVGYTPHTVVLEDNKEGKKVLKFTPQKGSYIPFDSKHYIRVRTCREKCG